MTSSKSWPTAVKDRNPKYAPAGKWWLEHPLRRQYRSVVFRPNEEVDDRLEYNIWRGLAVQPRAGEWPLLRELIEDVLAAGDRAGAKYLLNWAAYAVQRPERRAEVALVLRGGKGTGKSTFGRLMSRIFGQHGTTIASSHTMTSNFNKPLHDCCLLFADEALARGEAKAEGIIKTLGERRVRRRVADGYTSPEVMQIMGRRRVRRVGGSRGNSAR